MNLKWMRETDERLFALEQRARDQDAAEKLVMKEVMPSIIDQIKKVSPAWAEGYQSLVAQAQAIAHGHEIESLEETGFELMTTPDPERRLQLAKKFLELTSKTPAFQLQRAQGTCCPEPECDKIKHPVLCPRCGAFCNICKRGLI